MRLIPARALVAGLIPVALVGAALAYQGRGHAAPAEAAAPARVPASAAGPALPFPVEIRPRFSLIDQTGRAVTEADFAGRPMAIFFGYASCDAICSVALPAIGEALDLLDGEGDDITPLMITVDPEHDTPAAMARELPRYSPRLIGLTGSEAALADARAAFQVETAKVGDLPDGTPIYSHGSFIYLVGRDGVVKAVLPPILSSERIAQLMLKYL
jgi:protein SCO1/2